MPEMLFAIFLVFYWFQRQVFQIRLKNLLITVALWFSAIPAFAQGSYEEISSETVFLMAVFVFAFPIVSGILIFYIVRGILQGLTSRRKLQRKHRLINWAGAVGGALAVLLVMVLQIRLSI